MRRAKQSILTGLHGYQASTVNRLASNMRAAHSNEIAQSYPQALTSFQLHCTEIILDRSQSNRL